MNTEVMWEKKKRDLKLAVGICAIIAGCIATIALIMFGIIWMAGVTTSGPQGDARARVMSQCASRFEMGVYDEPCISLLGRP